MGVRGRISIACSSRSKTLLKLKFWQIVPCDESFPNCVYTLNLESFCKSYDSLNLWKPLAVH